MNDNDTENLRVLARRLRDSGSVPTPGIFAGVCQRAAARMEADRWVPCAERMPAIGDWTIIWGDRWAMPRIARRMQANDWFWVDHGTYVRGVTHWRPMPELPDA